MTFEIDWIMNLDEFKICKPGDELLLNKGAVVTVLEKMIRDANYKYDLKVLCKCGTVLFITIEDVFLKRNKHD